MTGITFLISEMPLRKGSNQLFSTPEARVITAITGSSFAIDEIQRRSISVSLIT